MGKAVLGVVVLLILLAIAIAVYPAPLSIQGFSIQLPPFPGQNISASTSAASLTVKNQQLSNSQALVEQAVFDKPGFVVVHADKDGTFGEVIGNTNVLSGKQENIRIGLDLSKAGGKIHVMLHYDDDSDGQYGFPDEDAPVTVNGDIVVTPVTLLPFLSVADQSYNQGRIQVDALYVDKTGFVVVHADENGTFGKIIGNSEPFVGYQENVLVRISLQEATPRLHVMLHYDNGDRAYYRGDEDPPVAVNGDIVVTPVLLLQQQNGSR